MQRRIRKINASMGHTVLELLAVLTIVSILSSIAINAVQKQLEQYNLKQDTRLLLHTLETAKNLALINHSNHEVKIIHQEIILKNQISEQHNALTGKNHISLARFPKTATPSITFAQTGHTDCQNGTFTLTSPHGYMRKIIINQGGRVYTPEL